MTRKDFELIARTIKNNPNCFVPGYSARTMADAIACTNANFDRAKFLRACIKHTLGEV